MSPTARALGAEIGVKEVFGEGHGDSTVPADEVRDGLDGLRWGGLDEAAAGDEGEHFAEWATSMASTASPQALPLPA